MNFWISSRWVLILTLWYHSDLGVQQCLVKITASRGNFSPPNITWNFLFMKDWFLFIFTDFVSWAGNWMFSTKNLVNQSTFDKGFPCVNLGLARLSYVNLFQDSRTHWSTLVLHWNLLLSKTSWRVVVMKLKVNNLTFFVNKLWQCFWKSNNW